ncbi:phosphatidylcholine transfer protein-like [Gigantopelta aegis]|uniref:phosphatidylcholine transfer protein-like n=1 Tax=Gigantopelta aegis TaxID=1735272 RepID=UPI001B889A80|nr:phosphatidylcholine transfer protein-like [Gigantopelta aegis]
MSTFEDSLFELACTELGNPQTDGWELFVESHDVTIYRLYTEASGLYEYKIYGFMKDVLPDVCAKVYMDLEYRKQWDSYVNELYETDVNGKKLIYWNINYPFFMSNRDYVYKRELREMTYAGMKAWVVLAQSEVSSSIPEKSGVIRVDDYKQSAVLTSDGEQGTKAFMHYYDNPKGMIPTWLINWGAKTGVPQFLTIMQKACRGYPEYLRKQQANG